MRQSLAQGSADSVPVSSLPFSPTQGVFREPSIFIVLVFIFLQIPFPTIPLFSHLYKTLGGVGISALYLATRLPRAEPRGHLATRHFPFVLSSLPPLGLSCLSFPHSLSLFSTACKLFSQNTGGVGYPCCFSPLVYPGRSRGAPRLTRAEPRGHSFTPSGAEGSLVYPERSRGATSRTR